MLIMLFIVFIFLVLSVVYMIDTYKHIPKEKQARYGYLFGSVILMGTIVAAFLGLKKRN